MLLIADHNLIHSRCKIGSAEEVLIARCIKELKAEGRLIRLKIYFTVLYISIASTVMWFQSE